MLKISKDRYKITIEYKTIITMFSKDEDREDYGLPRKRDIKQAINEELDNLFCRENEGLQVLQYYTIETLKDIRKIKIT